MEVARVYYVIIEGS